MPNISLQTAWDMNILESLNEDACHSKKHLEF